MIQFNPEGKEQLTYQETCGPAMKITNVEEARLYLEAYAAFIAKVQEERPQDGPYEDPLVVAKGNLGYYAGYYDGETQQRVEMLFQAIHPIFGSVSNEVTPAEAFKLGMEHAKKRA